MADQVKNIAIDSSILPADDTPKAKDVFQTEFEAEAKNDSSSMLGKTVPSYNNEEEDNILKNAKLYKYIPVKFSTDYAGVGLTNAILLNRYQAYNGGYGPINLTSNTPLNGLIQLGTSEIMEDILITGGYKLSTNLKDNEWFANYQNYRRRFDWGGTYYRNVVGFNFQFNGRTYPGKTITNLYQANVAYPFDESKSIRLTAGIRSDRDVYTVVPDPIQPDKPYNIPDTKKVFQTASLQYVYDNTLNPALNIWHGLRYKVYIDWNTDISKEKDNSGKFNFNWGFDARYYYPIYRNFIWAGRVSADFSWGSQKTIYYLGGTDGWLLFGNNQKDDGSFRYFNQNNQPAADQTYAFQSLANNMRGFIQNVANGNNAVVINSEFRFPVFSTLFSRPINASFLKNFQLVQFIDLGNAWNGSYGSIQRPNTTYGNPPAQVNLKVGGIGPFAGGYGFGARSTLLSYFLKFAAGWPMTGIFRGKPIYYFSMGLAF